MSMQEPEQEKCGTTHYAGCACHEQGWENKWRAAIEMAARAALERDTAITNLTAERERADDAGRAWKAATEELAEVVKQRDEQHIELGLGMETMARAEGVIYKLIEQRDALAEALRRIITKEDGLYLDILDAVDIADAALALTKGATP